MGRSIRMFEAEGVYFVTARTVQGRLLLRPSALLNDVVGGILARATREYGVALRGYVFMSNHLHLLVRAKGLVLSQFMQFVLSNIARKVGRLQNWKGPFWQRRFSCETVLDAEAELGRLRYILAHGVKEGLVAHPSDWPGLSCLKDLTGQEPRCFPFYNWDWRWTRRDLRGLGVWDHRLVEKETIVVEPISAWSRCDTDARRLFVQALVDSLAEDFRKLRGSQKTVGLAGVLRKGPHEPTPLDRKPRPLCHASSPLVRKQWLRLYRDFQEAYAVASRLFREGAPAVEFPRRAFLPPACWADPMGDQRTRAG